jgi:CheY-like chemotaxis protein
MARTRILIVDDEIGSTRLLKANLELTGRYEVRIESQPENAVGVAHEFKPHLFLLDIIMPTLSGTQLAAMLQTDPELSSIPIVFLTAAPTSLLPQGSDPILQGRPCIPKPACMEEILESLEKNLPLLPVPEQQIPTGPAQFLGANDE